MILEEIYNFSSYLIPFLFLITVVVFFHELGHFYIARLCNVKVDVFSIGFGKEIIGWNDKKGTRWKISWIPLGGYVKFFGDANMSSLPTDKNFKNISDKEKKMLFYLKPLYQRFAIVAAGPLANFILAIFIFSLTLMIYGKTILQPKVSLVEENSPAEISGVLTDDLITHIDNQKIQNINDVIRIVSMNANKKLSFIILRDGNEVELFVTPEVRTVDDQFGNKVERGLIGVQLVPHGEVELKKYNFSESIYFSTLQTYDFLSQTLKYLYKMITGSESTNQLGGPIKIAQISGQVADIGFFPLLNLIAYISISIGMINLFPIPVLDGGHLLFYIFEFFRGKPLSLKTQEFLFKIGFSALIFLMVYVTFNDLKNIGIF
jgi:regulator of sigma E protease